MKNIKRFFCILLVVLISFSFDPSGDEKIKGDLILKGKIITDRFFVPNGRVKIFLKKNENKNIESISIGGSFLGFPKIGTIIISELEKNCLNRFNISEGIDKDINITFENFDEEGGYINILIKTLDGIKEEKIYVLKTYEGNFDLYIFKKSYILKMESFNVNYSVGNGIIDYEINPE